MCSAQTGNSSVVTAGYDLPNPVAVAPGQLVTLSVTGIGNLSGPFRGAGEVFRAETLPLPASLAGLSVQVHQGAAAPLDVPVYSVYQVTNCPSLPSPPCAPVTAITVQIPYELFMQPAGLFVPPGASSFLRIFENGEARGDVEVLPWPSQVRIAGRCDSVARASATGPQSCGPLIAHPDGSAVSDTNPARSGGAVSIYAYGLGRVRAEVKAGEAAEAPIPVEEEVRVSFEFANRRQTDPPSPAEVTFAGLEPGRVGLYRIDLRVPEAPGGIPSCTAGRTANASVVVIASGRRASNDRAPICAAPQ